MDQRPPANSSQAADSPAAPRSPFLPSFPAAQAAREWALLTDALQAARAAPRAAKPDESAWLAGPHGARLADVAAFALGRGDLNTRARGAALLQRLDLQASVLPLPLPLPLP